MRIYEIAKENGISTKEILNFLQSIGIQKTAVSLVDGETLGRIHSHYGISSSGLDPGIGPSPHTLSDHWTLYDTLGYEPYAYTLYRFLTHEQSHPPLTVGIQAPWGGGKTSLMRMVQSHLDPYALEDEEVWSTGEDTEDGVTVRDILHLINRPRKPIQDWIAEDDSLSRFITEMQELVHSAWNSILEPFRTNRTESLDATNGMGESKDDLEKSFPLGTHRFTVWFNAWKYQNSGQVWAGLLDAIVRQVGDRMRPRQRERFLLELQLHRISRDGIRKRILARFASEFWQYGQWLAGGFIAGIVGFLAAGSLGWLLLQRIMAFWCLLYVAGTIGHFGWTFWRFRRKAAAERLAELVEPPNYKIEETNLESVDRDLRAVFDVLRQPGVWMHPDYHHYTLPLTVFVDDLDRCSPESTAAVIEGINRFLAGDFPEAIFVLGMDAEMVAASLEQAHHSILSSLPGNPAETLIGWRFMDKFVQLPFDIPVPSPENLENYTRSLFQDPLVSEGMKWAREAVWNFDESIRADIPSQDIADHILLELLDELDEISSERRDELYGILRNDIERQRRERTILDEGIARFSDEESDIQVLILEHASHFSRNPREIKRFLNVFRFRYALWWRRQKQDLPNASLNQLLRWVDFSLKWPHVLRWLRRSTLSEKESADSLQSASRIARGLQNLERIATEQPPQRAARFRELFQTDPYRLPWINDESLMAFFLQESRIPATDRLSSCEGRGMF